MNEYYVDYANFFFIIINEYYVDKAFLSMIFNMFYDTVQSET